MGKFRVRLVPLVDRAKARPISNLSNPVKFASLFVFEIDMRALRYLEQIYLLNSYFREDFELTFLGRIVNLSCHDVHSRDCHCHEGYFLVIVLTSLRLSA